MLQYCCNILCWRNGSATFSSATTNCGCSRMWEPPPPLITFSSLMTRIRSVQGWRRPCSSQLNTLFDNCEEKKNGCRSGDQLWLTHTWDCEALLTMTEWGFADRFQQKKWTYYVTHTTRLTEIYNSFWKVWRNSIHFGSSATFVLFRLNVQSRFLRWTQTEVFFSLHLFPDKSHPLKEYDGALNVLPETLMSGPMGRFHCSKCWFAFLRRRCLCSPGCFPAGRTINSLEGASELKQMDIYH